MCPDWFCLLLLYQFRRTKMKNLHLKKSGVCHTQKMLNWIFDTKGKSQLALLGFITLMEVCSLSLWLFFITFENKEMIPLYHPVQVSTLCTGIIWVLSSHHILWGRLLAKLSDCRFPSEIVACALIFPVAWVQLSSISAFVQNKYSWNSPKNSSSMEHTYFWWRWSICIYMYPENDG